MGILSALFGGGSQNSQSTSGSNGWSSSQTYNQVLPGLSQFFSPLLQYAGQGAGDLSSFLGGDASGFNNYKSATGFDQLLQRGSRGITGNAAARGLLNSGSTGMALENYGNSMQNQYANDYISHLLGLTGVGNTAGSLLEDAGKYSTSNSSNTSASQSTGAGSSNQGGLGDKLGALFSHFAGFSI